MKNEYLKNALLGALGLFCYFFLSSSMLLILEIFGIDIETFPTFLKITYSIIYQLLIICILLFIFKNKVINDIKDMKINHKKYFKECFKYWIIGLVVMFISNLIIIEINGKEISGNEEAIRNIFATNPIYIYISAVVIAPILEELTFRQCIKNIFPNKFLFLLISGLVFGYLHASTDLKSASDLLYIIPYGAFGVAFAYMLIKTENIFTSIGFHLMHNGLLIGLQFLVLIFS